MNTVDLCVFALGPGKHRIAHIPLPLAMTGCIQLLAVGGNRRGAPQMGEEGVLLHYKGKTSEFGIQWWKSDRGLLWKIVSSSGLSLSLLLVYIRYLRDQIDHCELAVGLNHHNVILHTHLTDTC